MSEGRIVLGGGWCFGLCSSIAAFGSYSRDRDDELLDHASLSPSVRWQFIVRLRSRDRFLPRSKWPGHSQSELRRNFMCTRIDVARVCRSRRASPDRVDILFVGILHLGDGSENETLSPSKFL